MKWKKSQKTKREITHPSSSRGVRRRAKLVRKTTRKRRTRCEMHCGVHVLGHNALRFRSSHGPQCLILQEKWKNAPIRVSASVGHFRCPPCSSNNNFILITQFRVVRNGVQKSVTKLGFVAWVQITKIFRRLSEKFRSFTKVTQKRPMT